MADMFSSLNGLMGGLELSFANPMGLAMNILLSTIVGGIVILIIVMIFAKKFSESVNPLHAFFVSLIISLINILGLMPVLGSMVAFLPLAGLIGLVLPIIVWFVLLKLFFKELGALHVLIISVICYLLSIFLIPTLVVMVAGMLPI